MQTHTHTTYVKYTFLNLGVSKIFLSLNRRPESRKEMIDNFDSLKNN